MSDARGSAAAPSASARRAACWALLLTGCTLPHASEDVADRPSLDASLEGGLDGAEAGDDSSTWHPACDSIIELSGRSTTDGAVAIRYEGDNFDAPERVTDALQPPPGRCDFRAIRQRLFRYRLSSDAALRVSTNNPGSDASFDSAIFIALAPCAATPRVLACNDDDPFASRPPHVTLSTATTGGLRAGTEVLISVSGFYPAPGAPQGPNPAGETGAFVLTVAEVPSRPVGESCDANARLNVCVSGSSCLVDEAGRATCVRDGSAPAARCAEGQQCDEPLRCDVRRNTCFQTSDAEGAICDLGESARRCGAGLSCVAALRGQRRGRCARDGTQGAACAADDGGAQRCDPGLRCSNAVCRRAIEVGASCNALTDACPTGTSCVPFAAGGGVGSCVVDGTAHLSRCRDSHDECDAPLFCIVDSARERTCRTVGRASGERCDNRGVCSFDWPCIVDDPSRPAEGVCRLPGETGAECANDMACTGGRRCVGRTTSALGRCLSLLAPGAACDVEGRLNACAAGTSCVREGSSGATGACVSNGSAAGAACRSSDPACDATLSCATDLGRRCVRTATIGEACDPRFNTVRCAGGAVCAATSFEAGSCATPTTESEPNDGLTVTARATPLVVRGAIHRFDVDCFGVEVPAGGGLFAQAVNPNGQCTHNLALDLYGPDGAWLGSDTDAGPSSCPRIDGLVYPWARALSQGLHRVCVREVNNNLVDAYALSIHIQDP
jgi:hypothetical protein